MQEGFRGLFPLEKEMPVQAGQTTGVPSRRKWEMTRKGELPSRVGFPWRVWSKLCQPLCKWPGEALSPATPPGGWEEARAPPSQHSEGGWSEATSRPPCPGLNFQPPLFKVPK